MPTAVLYFLQFVLFLILFIYIVKKLIGAKKDVDSLSGNVAKIYPANITDALSDLSWVIQSKIVKKENPLEFIHNYKKEKSILTASFPVKLVVIRDYNTIKEISSSENFADRPIGKVFSGRCAGATRGMLQNNGPSWKEVRKFTVKKLGQFGFGKKGKMSSFIEEELLDLFDYIDSSSVSMDNKIPVHDLFANSVVNVVWRIAASEKFSRNDPKYIAIKNNTITATSLSHAKILYYQCEPIRNIIKMAPSLFGFSEIFNALDNLRNYFIKAIETNAKLSAVYYCLPQDKNYPNTKILKYIIVGFVEARQQQGKYRACAEDFIDSFLQEIDECNESGDERQKNIFCIDELAAVLMDLFQAGMDTTNNTLEGAMMLMVKNPHVQHKMQKEIDEVVGKDTFPSYYEDKQKMPYTYATLLEINRIVNMIPFTARTAKEDYYVEGIKIKKGTYAFLQLYRVRMDEKFWGDPQLFRPERFLDSENNIIADKANRVFAFGGGMRVCPGEAVATSTLFAFFTGILQRYTLSRAYENEVLELCGSNSITNSVLPFHMSVTPRVK